MKKWNTREQQKVHERRIKNAKPTIRNLPFVPKQGSKPPRVKIGEGPKQPISNTAIYKLLKAFKLQQYARKFIELGYEDDFYKLNALNDNEKNELINSLKAFPGHRVKLMSVFSVINDMFPSEASLIQTCTKFSEAPYKTNKKHEPVHRAQSGEISGAKKVGVKVPQKKPISSEQRTKPLIAPTPERYQVEIKEEDVEEDFTKDYEEEKPGLGMGYFFEEGEVPREVEDLLLKYQNYTYELEASQAENDMENIIAKHKEPVEEKKTKVLEKELEPVEDVDEYQDDFEPEPGAENEKEIKEELSEEEYEKPEVEVENQYDPKTTVTPSTDSAPKKIIKKPDKCAASYDSATLDSAIGLLDLKLLCRCFAYAIHKHIVFSKGRALLSDLGEVEGKEPQNFAYKLNDMLKIDIPTKVEGTAYTVKEAPAVEEKKDKVDQLPPEKYKQLISESFSALTGQYIPPELLNSYLTLEGAEEDIDLSYTQTHLDDFIKSLKESGKDIDPNALIQNYKRSLNTFRSSKVLRERLLKSQAAKQMALQSHKDMSKVLQGLPKKSESRESLALEGRDSLEAPEVVVKKLPNERFEESTYGLADTTTYEKGPEYFSIQFAVFNLNYDFESETFVDFDNISPMFLMIPKERDIYKFCKKIMICSKMEKEIPIIALLYIEKLMLKTGLLMNQINWRRFTFIALVIGSKIWDDESFENVHFTKVFPDITLKEINELERVYLEMLEYKLHISGSEYAKYYFILRAFAEKVKHKFPLKPMPLDKILALQKNAKRFGEGLKEGFKEEYPTSLLEKTM